MSTPQNPNQTSQTPKSQMEKKIDVRISVPVSVLAVTVDHDGIWNMIYEIIPVIVNERRYILKRKRGKIITRNPKVIEELINMRKLAIYVDEYEACSRSMKHCMFYNTPDLLYCGIKDVIVLPAGIRIPVEYEERLEWCTDRKKVGVLEEFLNKIGHDTSIDYYLAFAVEEGIYRIYLLDHPVEITANVVVSSLDDIDEDKMNRVEHGSVEIFFEKVWVDLAIYDTVLNSENGAGIDVLRRSTIKIYGKELKVSSENGYPRFPIVIFIPGSVVGKKGVVFLLINHYEEEEVVVNICDRKVKVEPGAGIIIYARNKQ